jgi:carboxypeptidase Q
MKVNALAVLIRSMGSFSLLTPHTGATSYHDFIPQDIGLPVELTGSVSNGNRIPAAAISSEDAEMLSRMYKRAVLPIIRISMGASNVAAGSTSYNTIAEIRGTQFPDEVVLIGGHLDSWDVGFGTHAGRSSSFLERGEDAVAFL